MTSPAAQALGLFAAGPLAIGGVALRARWGPARDRWVAECRARLPEGTPWVPVPVGVDAERLSGDLDLAASLASGTPVHDAGLVARARGGVLVLTGADRLLPHQLAPILGALDHGQVAVLALDESAPEEGAIPASLAERLAIHATLDDRDPLADLPSREAVRTAAALAARVGLPMEAASLMSRLALHFGVASMRPPIQALAVSRIAAALEGAVIAGESHLSLAASLVLAPRASVVPAPEDATPPPPPPDPAEAPADTEGVQHGELEARMVEAVAAAVPPGLLGALAASRRDAGTGGRSGEARKGRGRGRTIGARQGDPRRGRMHLYATLITAAPWQPLRHRERPEAPTALIVHRDDIRIRRLLFPVSTITIFAVDASGSAALHRLAEAKGAVEALLAESYVRRDQVALVAFRGTEATLPLPPTRSLTRARRRLTGLAGGGGTPLASGITLSHRLAEQVRHGGSRPVLVLLTDGRANIDLQGNPGRPQAEADALAAARQVRAARLPAVLIDMAPRPNPFAATLATEMGARYLPLPALDGGLVARTVHEVAPA